MIILAVISILFIVTTVMKDRKEYFKWKSQN
jgi:hypothetical protein